MHFMDRLAELIGRRKNAIMVGLDPRKEWLPKGFLKQDEMQNRSAVAKAYGDFCKQVIDVACERVAVVKPQAAFFEEVGPPGMAALGEVIDYARQRGLLVVLDGKRNDIGSTASAYARAYLGADSAWKADALTVNPYLGDDSLSPFVETAIEQGAAVFVLVKTSNPGGKQFQDLIAQSEKHQSELYLHVARHVEGLSASTLGQSGFGVTGAVVGATYPDQLRQIRDAMPHTWFLVPGFGAQGAGAKDIAAAFDTRGLGAVINNSRGIIFAHRRPEFEQRFGEDRWQDAVAAAIDQMAQELAEHAPPANL